VARIPAGAYEDYLALGTERSYQALANRYGVSKTAVVKRAKKERWQDRLADLERQARERAEEKAVDEMEAVRERHLKEARFLQARALQALKDLPPEKGIRAASALNVAWKHELLLLGEPTERQANVEELIKRETRDLLMVVDDEDDPLNGSGWPPSGS
jgi:ATPase subunit of ABC transporter with duplicated ATPase domains